MKANKELIFYFLFAILCTNLTGCGTIPSYEELGNGYVEATYIRTSWEPPAIRTELRYKKGWRTVVIWPKTLGIIVTNDVALFCAYKAYDEPSSNNPQATKRRLFAVIAPNLPLDITDELLWRWSKQSGEDFAKLLKTASIANLEEKNNAVEFLFAADWNKDAIICLDWNQISDVMREVKEKGVVRKDRVWGTSYIEKEFKPETKSN
jgi:hypothetical protein